MTKLTIGGTPPQPKKVQVPTIIDDFAEMSGEELAKLEASVNQDIITEETKDMEKAVETVKEIAKNKDTEMEKLLNLGFEPDYVNEVRKLGKQPIYHGLITKKFLEEYIQITPRDITKELHIQSPFFTDNIRKWFETVVLGKALPKSPEKPKEEKNIVIEPKTKEEKALYEQILTKEWDNRGKGIFELDLMIKDQLYLKGVSLFEALANLANAFDLKKGKTEQKTIKPTEIDKSIKYFHHIKFLYNLLSDDRMELKSEFTDTEMEKIREIDELINSRIEQKPEVKKQEGTLDEFTGESFEIE